MREAIADEMETWPEVGRGVALLISARIDDGAAFKQLAVAVVAASAAAAAAAAAVVVVTAKRRRTDSVRPNSALSTAGSSKGHRPKTIEERKMGSAIKWESNAPCRPNVHLNANGQMSWLIDRLPHR